MRYHLYLFKIRRHEIHLSKNAGSVLLHGKSKDQSLGMWLNQMLYTFEKDSKSRALKKRENYIWCSAHLKLS